MLVDKQESTMCPSIDRCLKQICWDWTCQSLWDPFDGVSFWWDCSVSLYGIPFRGLSYLKRLLHIIAFSNYILNPFIQIGLVHNNSYLTVTSQLPVYSLPQPQPNKYGFTTAQITSFFEDADQCGLTNYTQVSSLNVGWITSMDTLTDRVDDDWNRWTTGCKKPDKVLDAGNLVEQHILFRLLLNYQAFENSLIICTLLQKCSYSFNSGEYDMACVDIIGHTDKSHER